MHEVSEEQGNRDDQELPASKPRLRMHTADSWHCNNFRDRIHFFDNACLFPGMHLQTKQPLKQPITEMWFEKI